MKILHTSDWHLGKRLDQFSRIEEQKEVLNELIEIAETEAVHAVVICGDIFDTPNPPIEAVELLYKSLKKLADGGRRAVIAIAGNHDSPDRIDAPEPLARECGILVAGYPNTRITPFELESGLKVLQSDEGFLELKLPNAVQPLRVILTPYANECRLKTFLGSDNPEEELRRVLARTWQRLADTYCDDQGVNLIAAHLYMGKNGVELPEEPEDEKPIRIGGAHEVFTECLPTSIHYAALGHLHRQQTIDTHPCLSVYSGSILSYSFSEAHQEKYVMRIEASGNHQVHLMPIKLSKGKPLIRKRFENTDEAVSWLKEHPNCLIELTMATDTYLTADARKRLYNAHDGIVTIIPEVWYTSESEAPRRSVDPTQGIESLFADYFKYRHGQEPNEAMKSLFREVLAEDGKRADRGKSV